MAIDRNPSIDIQKKMARLYVNENCFDKALDIYLNILRTSPDDPEVLRELGELYLLAGNNKTAEGIFSSISQRQLVGGGASQGSEVNGPNANGDRLEEPVPTSLPALRRLSEKLKHREQIASSEEMTLAANLLNEIVNSSTPAAEVAEHLNEIDSLLPALIDLNIQQAKNDGRLDIVAGLRDLKTNITLQKSIYDNSIQHLCVNDGKDFDLNEKFTGKISIFQAMDNEVGSNNDRIELLKSTLLSGGNLVAEEDPHEQIDLAIFSNPFNDSRLMEKMVKLSTAKVPIILDLDQYNEQILLLSSKNAFKVAPPKTFERNYLLSFFLADLITTASVSFTKSLWSAGYPAMTISNGWSIANPYWSSKPNTTGAILQMGWFGSSGSLDDLAVIRRPLIRLLREFDDKLRLIIVGDQDAYRMFDHVPDQLKTFLPTPTQDEIPFVLNQMDIVLLPWRKNFANEMRSDEVLMYAGIKKIPWIASSFPVVTNWGKGGMVCKTVEEWHTNLRCLILDGDLRQTLGNAGFHSAAQREMLNHVHQWYKAFNLVQSLWQRKNSVATTQCTGDSNF